MQKHLEFICFYIQLPKSILFSNKTIFSPSIYKVLQEGCILESKLLKVVATLGLSQVEESPGSNDRLRRTWIGRGLQPTCQQNRKCLITIRKHPVFADRRSSVCSFLYRPGNQTQCPRNLSVPESDSVAEGFIIGHLMQVCRNDYMKDHIIIKNHHRITTDN